MKKSKTKIVALCACCLSLTFALSACSGSGRNTHYFPECNIYSIAQNPINLGAGVNTVGALPSPNDGLITVCKNINSTNYYGIFSIDKQTMVFAPSPEHNITTLANIKVIPVESGGFDYFTIKDASNKVKVYTASGRDITSTITGQDTANQIHVVGAKAENYTMEKWTFTLADNTNSKYFKVTSTNSRTACNFETTSPEEQAKMPLFDLYGPSLDGSLYDWSVSRDTTATTEIASFYNGSGLKVSELTINNINQQNPLHMFYLNNGGDPRDQGAPALHLDPILVGSSVYYQNITQIPPDTQDETSYNWVYGETKYMVTLNQFDIKTGQSTQHNLNGFVDTTLVVDNNHLVIQTVKFENKQIPNITNAEIRMNAAELYLAVSANITKIANKEFFMTNPSFSTMQIAGNKFLAAGGSGVYGVLDASFNVVTDFTTIQPYGFEFINSTKAFLYENDTTGMLGLVDVNGNNLTEAKYDYIESVFTNGYAIMVAETGDEETYTTTYYAVAEDGTEKIMAQMIDIYETGETTYTFQGQPCETVYVDTYAIHVVTKQVANASTTYTGATYNFAGKKLFEKAGYDNELAGDQEIWSYGSTIFKALFVYTDFDGTTKIHTVNTTNKSNSPTIIIEQG